MVRLKLAHPHWGPRKIRELYHRQYGKAASESSFKRVLERSGLTQKRKVRPASRGGRLCSGRTAQEPNQVWTVDFKGWWYSGLARCEPLTVGDEYSRYLLELRALKDARTETVQKRFEHLFESYGLPEAIRSDNGSPFASECAVHGLSRLSAWCASPTKEVVGIHVLPSRSLFGGGTLRRLLLRVSLAKSTSAALRCRWLRRTKPQFLFPQHQ
jgi:transposase InsO family protein